MHWDKHDPHVPVDKNGNWQHYPDYQNKGWVRVKPFYEELTIDSMRSGRSAKYIILVDGGGKSYPMFLSDLIKFIKTVTIERGVMRGHWTASKRGKNYGIRPLSEKEYAGIYMQAAHRVDNDA